MERLKTLSHRDPDFLSYLEGTFSRTHRALPIRSLNVDTAGEEVTFEIKPFSEVGAPSWAAVLWMLTRPQTLILSAGPMIATLFYCIARDLEFQRVVAATSFVGVLLFHIAVNLFNDYGDHIKGQDRLRPGGGSRVIQRGWIRAVAVKRSAWVLTALAFLFGLPAIILHFSPVLIVAGLAGLAGLEFAFQRVRLKAHGLSEIVAFALTGPLLAWGYAWAVSGDVTWAEGALGCVFGAISLMYFHSANFENIMVDSQAGARTWATRAGFDASKRFFYFTATLVFACTIIFSVFFDREWRLILVLAAQALILIQVSRRVLALASPLASGLTGLRTQAVRLCWATAIAFSLVYVWIALMKPVSLP